MGQNTLRIGDLTHTPMVLVACQPPQADLATMQVIRNISKMLHSVNIKISIRSIRHFWSLYRHSYIYIYIYISYIYIYIHIYLCLNSSFNTHFLRAVTISSSRAIPPGGGQNRGTRNHLEPDVLEEEPSLNSMDDWFELAEVGHETFMIFKFCSI